MQLPDVSTLAKIRVAALLAILSCVFGGYLLCQQEYRRMQESHAAWRTQRAHVASSWHRLLPSAVTPLGLSGQNATPVPFSPVVFQRAGAKLVSWLPSAKGGDMVLDTPWAQVAPVFIMLAERDMRVAAFSLSLENSVLRFSLQLVGDDEP